MSYEATKENLLAYMREEAPDGVETEADENAFYDAFEEIESERENEYWNVVVKHKASGKFFEAVFNYDSWNGIDFEYPVQDPVEVEQKQVTVTRWVAVK